MARPKAVPKSRAELAREALERFVKAARPGVTRVEIATDCPEQGRAVVRSVTWLFGEGPGRLAVLSERRKHALKTLALCAACEDFLASWAPGRKHPEAHRADRDKLYWVVGEVTKP